MEEKECLGSDPIKQEKGRFEKRRRRGRAGSEHGERPKRLRFLTAGGGSGEAVTRAASRSMYTRSIEKASRERR